MMFLRPPNESYISFYLKIQLVPNTWPNWGFNSCNYIHTAQFRKMMYANPTQTALSQEYTLFLGHPVPPQYSVYDGTPRICP